MNNKCKYCGSKARPNTKIFGVIIINHHQHNNNVVAYDDSEGREEKGDEQ
jgi:hypothetical protein